MTGADSLGAAYFDGIFQSDADPWDLASSAYEQRKFDRTIAVLADRRYAAALEVGCAHGVLTRRLDDLCDRLLAIDISAAALRRARERLGAPPGIAFAQMAFPAQSPEGRFDLCVLSEVAYYWGVADLARAARWLTGHVAQGGRVLLVHYTGATDYPCTADEATGALALATAGHFSPVLVERHEGYRLDLWERR